MSNFPNLVRVFFPGALTALLLHSCGLKYTPPETPWEFEERRHQAIEDYIRVNLDKDSASYTSIAFGETTVIKPTSFRILDSLYEKKYQNEKKGINDSALDEVIGNHRMKIKNDTNTVNYLEYHIFSYQEGESDSSRVVQTEILVNPEMKVIDQEIIETALIPKKKEEYYKKYIFEESFIYPGSVATSEEEKFYRYFKDASLTLNPVEKEQLLQHTLNLMELAFEKKSVRTSDLLISQARILLISNSKELPAEEFSDVFSTLETQIDGTEKLSSYWFTVNFVANETGENKQQYYFRFDPYLRLELMQKLDF